jgi:kynureninase
VENDPVSTREQAAALDRDDPLASFRDQFVFADQRIYLDGNSLGRLPKRTRERISEVLATEWGERLIASWSKGGWSCRSRSGTRSQPRSSGPRLDRSRWRFDDRLLLQARLRRSRRAT